MKHTDSVKNRPSAHEQFHAHMWLFGILGFVVGLILLVYVPTLKPVSSSLLLFAGFHLIGGIVLAATLYFVVLRKILRRRMRHWRGGDASAGKKFDFGWGPAWMNGLAIAALVAVAVAIALQSMAPAWWPLSFVLILLAASFVAGNHIMRAFRSLDCVVLPMVDLLSGENDLVLDAGCGAGRTTIALSRVLGQGRVVALDRFDAEYIDEGGRELLKKNLRLAGLTDRVRIETGDLTAIPFPDNHFDSAVSTHVFDHLGRHKEQALREVLRVLKPGGRFLMAVWVPGLSMFAVANALSLLLTSRDGWKNIARRAGFEVLDEGVFNGTWFAVLGKPGAHISR